MTIDPLHIPSLAAGTDSSWQGLSATAVSLAIANAAQTYNRPLIVIPPDAQTAARLHAELAFFSQSPLYSLPDWETLPYDSFSPHKDIISERLQVLYQLPRLQQGIVIIPQTTLLQRVAPRAYIEAHSLQLRVGETCDLSTMRQQLVDYGYRSVEQVMEHGEFAVRGGIIDLYPMGCELPLRVELFDDEIDNLRSFQPDTQRSAEKLEHFQLLPAHEFPLNDAAISHFRQRWRELFAGNPSACPVYREVSDGLSPAGIEYFLPLFFQQTASLFDYFPANSVIIADQATSDAAQPHWQSIQERYEQRRHDQQRPILPPEQLFFSPEILANQQSQFATITFTRTNTALPDIAKDQQQGLGKLENFLLSHPDRVLLCAESTGRLQALQTLLQQQGLSAKPCDSWQAFLRSDAPLSITTAELDHGLRLSNPALFVIAEAQLYGEQVMQRRRRKTTSTDTQTVINNLNELAIGMPVVHIDHGVGRYLGLETLNSGEQTAEYLTLGYADNNKLYVPITSLQLISRYGGMDSDKVTLHSLGGKQWLNAREKAAKRAYDVAAELLAIHAQRASQQGNHFRVNTPDYQAFTQAFGFEETPDQQQTISQVEADMASDKPMDRLVCGDVGFGKTEVAMRATFIAAQNGKQIAILVPTTLLAQQHYSNFCDRFADSAVNIALLSRFRSAQQQSETLQKMANGGVDIVIGTHKLLQKPIKFANLGLLIIDEEHRFGVRQKEKIKALRANVDMLTLTATPIPRTLNMALSDVRDLSIIATPPAKRLAIKTFAHEFELPVIREAVMRELSRGGQVYYLHNRVDTIAARARELEELIPEAKIIIGHGQMPEKQLEQVMRDFYHQRFTILLCTTIIETGIDVPTANTIIIERADKFGLAQLHQLRGRVGRSHHQAYAYLLTPEAAAMTADAKKRLDALSQLEDLGVGFTLATHDLEIRGAGEFLGDEQSGHIQTVGFSLYMEFLERAVASIKAGNPMSIQPSNDNNVEIDLAIATLIPDDYIGDVHTRLVLYKRISSAKDHDTLQELKVEMVDRFGLLPPACEQLFAVTLLKLDAIKLGIEKISVSGEWLRIVFCAKPNIDPMVIIGLIQRESDRYQLQGQDVLRVKLAGVDAELRLMGVRDVFERLTNQN